MLIIKKICFALVALAVLAPFARPAAAQGTLRVCADPAYMPYSDRAGEGFENKVAQAVAGFLGAKLSYTWFSMRNTSGFHTTGGWDEFIHETLRANKCDVVIDVPYANVALLTTQPYYVSSYVFLFDKTKGYDIHSLDSPVLRNLKIGFESETPPEDGLKMRGILLANGVPFDIAGTDGESPATMLDALRSGRIQVAITWEPAIGYFLRDGTYSRLAVVPLPNSRQRGVPEQYIFPMAMGVRPDDRAMKKRLDAVIAAHKSELVAILARYGVKLYHPNVNPY